ncbi:MAG: GNAT family N-acetyltransferase [Candidatus Thorarchaeota archaeon]
MTLQIETRKLSLEECTTIAEISVANRRGTPLESGKTIEEISQNIVRISENEKYEIVIAEENGKIVGCIYYYLGFPLMAFISGFSPIIDPARDSEMIAIALIEASKKNIIEKGYTRLEIEFVLLSNEHRNLSRKYIGRYEKCGFRFAAEEVHMKVDLSTIDLPTLERPNEYTIRRFTEVPYEKLEESGFQTFENGKDQLFRSMSHAEQQVTLQVFFDKNSPFVDEASLVLEKKEQVIGFIITRPGDKESTIGPVGLIPEEKGKGLGSYLLVQALVALRNDNQSAAVLDMSVGNTPARNLYSKYGFKPEYYKQFYYWAP